MQLSRPSSSKSGDLRAYLRPEVAAWAATSGAAILAAVATAILLAGCSYSDINPKSRPIDAAQLKSDQALATPVSEANWPQTQWWRDFGDEKLNALIDEALTGSPNLRLAEARLAKANAQAGLAQAMANPNLSAQSSSIREKFTSNYIYPPPLGGNIGTTNTLGLNFSWELDFWGKNRAAIDAARAQAKAAAADQSAARLALATSITRAWVQLQRIATLRDVVDASIRQREDIVALTGQRVTAGLETNVDLRQAEALLLEARVDREQLVENSQLVRNQIAALLGAGPDRGASLSEPDLKAGDAIALPAALPANLLGRRPDLVAARWRVEASGHEIDVAKAQFYPNVNLMATAGFISIGNANFVKSSSQDNSIGPAITLPLFPGVLRANLSAKDADYDAAVEQYNQSVVDALKDVADQVTSLRGIEAQRESQLGARDKTEQAYGLAVERYKAGLGNYLTVLIAESSVLQQRRAVAELKARALETHVNLVRALGGGFDDSVPPLATR